MKKAGHHLTGIGAAMIAFALLNHYGGFAAGAAFAAIPGGTAPDWMECPSYDDAGRRHSAIPHRTVTHWLPLWLLLATYTFLHRIESPFYAVCFGFSLGCLMHLAMDAPNPMGIPVAHPYKRKSLRWWRSGEHELPLVAATWLLGIACLHFL